MTDESIMPWGIHKGKRLADVPDSYLLWLTTKDEPVRGDLAKYINENLEAIKQNIERKKIRK